MELFGYNGDSFKGKQVIENRLHPIITIVIYYGETKWYCKIDFDTTIIKNIFI